MQSLVRVWLRRTAYKKQRRARLTSLKMVMQFKKSLMSERNSQWAHLGTHFPKQNVVAKFLEKEGEESEQLLAAMAMHEEEEAACEEARAAAQLDRISRDEAVANKEMAEAVEAEAKLKKEEEEAIEWRSRQEALEADAEKFQALVESKGDKATTHERQILSNKLTLLEKTKGRAGREWDQYQHALKVWMKERDEALEALAVLREARKQWDLDKHLRWKDRDTRERNRCARLYISAHMHEHVYTYTHIHMYTYIHTHMYTHTNIYIYTCSHIYIYACIYTCIHTYMHTYVHIWHVRAPYHIKNTHAQARHALPRRAQVRASKVTGGQLRPAGSNQCSPPSAAPCVIRQNAAQ